jgi:hypothetical protein
LFGTQTFVPFGAPTLRRSEGVHDERAFARLIGRLELVHAYANFGGFSLFGRETIRVREAMGVFAVFPRIDAKVLNVVVVRADDESHIGRAIVARSRIDRGCDWDMQHGHGEGQGRDDGIEHAFSTQRKRRPLRYEV